MRVRGRVTSKGQTTIPKIVRERLGLREGSTIDWEVGDDRAFIVPRTGRLMDLAGILGNPLGRTVTVEEMNEAVAEAVVERFERSVDRR